MDGWMDGLSHDLGSGLGGLDTVDGLSVVLGAEDGRTSDDGIGTSLDDLVGVGGADTAVNLDPGVDPALVAHLLQATNLLNLRFDELLATEARVDGHDEDKVDDIKDLLDLRKRGARVKDNTGVTTKILDLVHGTVQVDGGGILTVDGNDVGTSLGEVRDTLLGLDDHKVTVEDLVRDRANRVDHERADGDVGDEAAIHHIDVDPLGTSLVDGLNLLTKPGEVGGKDGRGDNDGVLVAGSNALVDSRALESASGSGLGDESGSEHGQKLLV
jgi:hypothetical protein